MGRPYPPSAVESSVDPNILHGYVDSATPQDRLQCTSSDPV